MTTSALITGIDAHAHIFDPDAPMVPGRRYSPTYVASVTAWLTHMETAKISHGVLIQPSFYGIDNGLIAEALAEYPQRLRGIAVVDPTLTDAALEKLDAQGFVGARLNLVGKELEDYSNAAWQRFFRRLAEIGWQVEIQRAFEDFASILPAIAPSGCPVMIDHFGLPKGGIDLANPAHVAVLDALRAAPDAWVKLSAPYRSSQTAVQAAASLVHLRNALGGMDRFVWGSDWPHTQHETATNYAEQVERLTTLVSHPADRHRILVDNPAALFRFT
ncbi:amidohydrolase family protein [Tropicimonas isoalkanivorans]|uniref:Predicted metal-dependent hydrolase, TIM-barrel fold n=1 Tax=Tropicimonas isoalkanivorans TaxID=441112 RepID=A0A1I1IPU7_9RHOB|nr:amidohydrolase family protein [Tropicimonas isoalkanivorans]SFC37722.1 Predicted metal-dependent hydrolase, TIM-barrel fold [Tropicimonas isoalkanivorans]